MLNTYSSMVESVSDSVVLQNVTSAGLSVVLDFMYCIDKLNINMHNAGDVLNAASMLQIPGVIEKCKTLLLESCNTDNYLEIRNLCNQFSLTDVIETLDV